MEDKPLKIYKKIEELEKKLLQKRLPADNWVKKTYEKIEKNKKWRWFRSDIDYHIELNAAKQTIEAFDTALSIIRRIKEFFEEEEQNEPEQEQTKR